MRSGSLLINALFPACLLRRQAGLVVDGARPMGRAPLFFGRPPQPRGGGVRHKKKGGPAVGRPSRPGGARPPIEALVLYIITTLIDYLVSHLL